MKKYLILVLFVLLTAIGSQAWQFITQEQKEQAKTSLRLEVAPETTDSTNATAALFPLPDNPSLTKSGKVTAPWKDVRLKGIKRAGPDYQMPDIYGYVQSSKNGLKKGLYRLPRNANDSFKLLVNGFESEFKGCLVGDDYYSYWTRKIAFGRVTIGYYEAHNINTGEMVASPSAITDSRDDDAPIFGMSYNPVDKKIYGICGYGGLGSSLCTIEYPNRKALPVTITPIAVWGNAVIASFAIDNNGQGFVIDREGYLYKMNLSNGEVQKVGFTEVVPATHKSDMTFDYKTGRLFLSAKEATKDKVAIYEVNPATAETTLIAEYPGKEEVTGLFTLDPINDKAPGKGTALSAQFEKASKTGSFSFTAPTTLADGTAASGSVDYSVYVNDKEMYSGTTKYGQQTTLSPVTVSDRGKVFFTVIFTNDAGDSPKAQCSANIGNAVPATPYSFSFIARKSDNGIKVKWDPVRTAVDECYFDPTQVKYDLYRYCEGDGSRTLIASEISDTTFTDVFAAPEKATVYQYQVYAKFATETSNVCYSNHVVLGYKNLPFISDFSTPYSLLDWNIFDMNPENSSGTTWKWHSAPWPGTPAFAYLSNPTHGRKMTDDWLITPLLKVQSGKAYRVRLNAATYSSSVGAKIAMYYGNASNPESMDTVNGVLVSTTEPVELRDSIGSFYERWIVPEKDEAISVGIHGKTPNSLAVLRFEIAEGVDARRPGAVRDLKATGEIKQLKAHLKFDAPSVNFMNQTLNSLTKIEILRDDTVKIGTINNPTPGAPLEVNLDNAAPGTHRYTVVPFNEFGEGAVQSVTVKVGFDAPLHPEMAKQVETSTLGTTVLTWAPVTKTTTDQELTGEDVAYNIALIENGAVGKLLHKNYRDTTARVVLQSPSAEQNFAGVCIQAVTNGGQSQWQAAEDIPVGKPYTNYYHCFASGGLDGFILGYTDLAGRNNTASIMLDALNPNFKSVTGDGGYIGIMMQQKDAMMDIFSGKISLANITHPGMTFYVYNVEGDDTNLFKVLVRECGKEWLEVLPDTEVMSLGGAGWNMAYVPLEQFKGKNIQYKIVATGKSYKFNGFDDIKVGEIAVNDIGAQNIVTPKSAFLGEQLNVTATTVNNGSNDATNVTMELLCNGKVVGTFTADTIRAFKKYNHTFKVEIPAEDKRKAEFQLRVNYSDEDASNNISELKTVIVESSELPGVGLLTGEALEGSNKMNWNTPVRQDMEWTYDFESGIPGEQEYRNWTFIDKDGYTIGGYDNVPIAGVTAGETKAAFVLHDGHLLGRNWAAHSGDMCLINIFRFDGGRVDDWAISPELSGEGQTITFWSRNLIDEEAYRGTFSVCYSTTGKETTDFVEVEGFKNISAGNQWTQYEVTLPAGAKYFAIHSNGKGPWIQFFDDFTMWIKGADNFTLSGYNVYRDGERLNENPFTTNSFSDNEPLPGVHTYAVIPVFEQGAGRPSFISLETNGVETLTKGVVVSAEGHSIVIAGAEGLALSITSADGKVIYSAKGTDRTVVPVSPGIYMVRVAGKTVKILVK